MNYGQIKCRVKFKINLDLKNFHKCYNYKKSNSIQMNKWLTMRITLNSKWNYNKNPINFMKMMKLLM